MVVVFEARLDVFGSACCWTGPGRRQDGSVHGTRPCRCCDAQLRQARATAYCSEYSTDPSGIYETRLGKRVGVSFASHDLWLVRPPTVSDAVHREEDLECLRAVSAHARLCWRQRRPRSNCRSREAQGTRQEFAEVFVVLGVALKRCGHGVASTDSAGTQRGALGHRCLAHEKDGCGGLALSADGHRWSVRRDVRDLGEPQDVTLRGRASTQGQN